LPQTNRFITFCQFPHSVSNDLSLTTSQHPALYNW